MKRLKVPVFRRRAQRPGQPHRSSVPQKDAKRTAYPISRMRTRAISKYKDENRRVSSAFSGIINNFRIPIDPIHPLAGLTLCRSDMWKDDFRQGASCLQLILHNFIIYSNCNRSVIPIQLLIMISHVNFLSPFVLKRRTSCRSNS